MNIISALEIFTNPYDLDFIVGSNPEKLGTYGIVIARGPEHRGKLIVTGEGCTSKESAIKTIIELLNICVTKGNEIILKQPKNNAEEIIKAMINPTDLPPEKWMNALTFDMVKQIEKELNEKESCSTCGWLVLLQKESTFAIALTNWDNVLDKSEGKDEAINMINNNTPRLTIGKSEKFIKKVKNFYRIKEVH